MADQYFISYSRQDRPFAEKLESALRKAGIPTWRDRKQLAAGEIWAEEIPIAIAKSPAIILLISPDSVRSPWVRRELLFACGNGKCVIPVICRKATLTSTFRFLIGEYQWLDLTEKSFGDGVRDLVDAIHSAATVGSPPRSRPPAEVGPFRMYVEDIQEFLPKVPRVMWRRLFSFAGLSWRQNLLRSFIIQPPGVLAFFLWLLSIDFIVALLAMVFYGGSFDLLLYGIAKTLPVVAIVALISGMGVRSCARREVARLVPQVFIHLPNRPDPTSPNKLLEKWPGTVKAIIMQLLELDERPSSFEEYVKQRCPDPELAEQVEQTFLVLAAVGIPDVLANERERLHVAR